PLSRVLSLDVGQTLIFDVEPDDPVTIKCGNVELSEGTLGKVEDSIAIRVTRGLRKPKMTLAAFERAMQKEMETS
ncbi:MAG: FliM/FliN family flagellar motor switch protein, partial [Pannonibacter phragmitetus]